MKGSWRHLLIWETLFFIGPEPNWQKVDSLSARKMLDTEQWNSNVWTEFYRNISHHIFSKNLLRFGVLGYVIGVQSYLLTFGVWKPHFLDIPKQIKKKTKTCFFLSEFLEGILSQDLQIIFSGGHLDVGSGMLSFQSICEVSKPWWETMGICEQKDVRWDKVIDKHNDKQSETHFTNINKVIDVRPVCFLKTTPHKIEHTNHGHI